MLKHADPILKICLALGILSAGTGVGYYYGIYLPAQDIRRQTQEMAEKQAVAAEQAQALADRARFEREVQATYDQCLGSAETLYRQRWTHACQAMHNADQSAFDDCADDLFSTHSGCLAKHPIRPAQDCALPSEAAQAISDAREQRKGQCAADLKAAQQSSRAKFS